ncbi:MAG: hypothetical protein QOI04_1553 [Verrucomicrobiota bacterium]|jgi:hypothetical protein
MKRPPVIIIGAHRSGTSATAHALQLLGLQIGQRLDSHYEPRGLQQVHDDYLRSVGAAWYDPKIFLEHVQTAQGREDCLHYLRETMRADFMSILGYRNLRGWWLRSKINSGKPWGWKEPRTTLFARCWLDIFPDGRFIHVVRHPLAAAVSIRERELQFENGPRSERLHDLEFCLELVLAYAEAGEALADSAKHFQRIRFEDLQVDPIVKLKAVAEFCDLSFNDRQLLDAATTIRPTVASPAPPFPGKVYVDLVAKYPRAAKLGYDLPPTSRKSSA